MTISLCQADRGSDSRRWLSCLMVAVYLLVVHYSLSHVHTAQEQSLKPEIPWQHPVASIADDASDHHDHEHRHSSACMLVSQASSPVHWLKAKVRFGPVHNHRPYRLSVHSVTPTKRQTRAPPEYNV
ncbi:hypothetical protein [Endozoicomonas sp. SCSIO W0465]|uniref:hypothetical protein n=1 Tax=Endozoicomonas sp. SCSIO W0465 TaxID=2918516 RepID=UPI0020758950|nr:hypothetical protein [Endozoicomonas sp. SCSIO W0465]USE38783.1 hypothetical protein MJO57_11780 [Endozoicomonas sp. SCSIO W0465]